MRRADVPVRRSYRFRLAGVLYLSVTAFLAVAAISSQNNLLFWSLGLATAGIAVSGVVSGAGLVGLRVEREAIPDATAGGAFRVRYRVENVNRLVPAFGLIIYERTPPRRRRVAHPWQRHVGRPVAFVSAIGPRRVVMAEAETKALRRGEPVLTDFVVSSSFPFGLATKTLRFAQTRAALVYPAAAAVDERLLSSRAGGRQRTTGRLRRGAPVGEFFGLREYVQGDPMRSIAWKPSARLEQWVVRQDAEPAPALVWLTLEIPPSTEAELVERTMSLTAGVIKLAVERGLAFSLRSEGLGIALPPGLGAGAMRRALGALAIADPRTGPVADRPKALALPGPRDLVLSIAPTEGVMPAVGRAVLADRPDSWAPVSRARKAGA